MTGHVNKLPTRKAAGAYIETLPPTYFADARPPFQVVTHDAAARGQLYFLLDEISRHATPYSLIAHYHHFPGRTTLSPANLISLIMK